MESKLLTADRLFDATGTATTLRPQLRISADKIDSLTGTLSPPATCSGETFDFPGCTIVPGLIDTHVHLIFSAQDTREQIIEQVTSETTEQLYERAKANAVAAMQVGITTVRDCGGKETIIQRLRDQVRKGEVTACDIISCGVPITTTLGHCNWLGLIANDQTEVKQAVEKMLAEDADWLKVMATGGNMTATSDPLVAQYDDAALQLIADMGRQAGKYSAAHVLSQAALPGAVKAGYRTIEHCNWRVNEQTYEFKPDLGKLMIDQQQYPGLTMSGNIRRAVHPELDELPRLGANQFLEDRFQTERQMIDFGVPFTLHSDAGVMRTPIEKFVEGLRCAAVELQLTPAEVIVAATRTAAEAIDLPDRGTLVAGKRADLLVVEGNPLNDLSCLHNVRAVMKAGEWVYRV